MVLQEPLQHSLLVVQVEPEPRQLPPLELPLPPEQLPGTGFPCEMQVDPPLLELLEPPLLEPLETPLLELGSQTAT